MKDGNMGMRRDGRKISFITKIPVIQEQIKLRGKERLEALLAP